MPKYTNIRNFALLLILITSVHSFSQDPSSSLAFKENRVSRPKSVFYRPDPSYQIRQQFTLLKQANSGDPIAQHELGLRYLLGEGFAADTIEGAKWIGKAAGKGLASASFNYAILLINGWGVEWNPFESYKYFLSAAQNGMPAAEHILGLLHLENLIVKKDFPTAHYWLKRAAQSGYKPAKETLADLGKRIAEEKLDIDTSSVPPGIKPNTSVNNSEPTVNTNTGLVFIDFDAIRDTVKPITEQDIINDLFFTGNDSLIAALNLDKNKSDGISLSDLLFEVVNSFSNKGSPEVYTLLGYLYENGIMVPADHILAAEYYIRAVRLDSYRAPYLLWQLVQKKDFFKYLKSEADKNNPSAMFVFTGLLITGFDNQITREDAFNLLQKAAGLNHIPSLVELALSYYTGNISPVNKENAIEIWQLAERLGSAEAKVRLAAANIFDNPNVNVSPDIIKLLREGDITGSVMAQVTLAYCYKNGLGVIQQLGEAVKYYRYAAQRGSRFALDELLKIYDSKRPGDPAFDLN